MKKQVDGMGEMSKRDTAPELTDEDKIKRLELQLGFQRTHAENLESLIGQPPAGKHQDEWLPRGLTWHQERLNWIKEVEGLREHIWTITHDMKTLQDENEEKDREIERLRLARDRLGAAVVEEARARQAAEAHIRGLKD